MTDARRALVLGVTGQDGAFLSRLLLAKGYMETRPWRTNFDLAWRRDGDRWGLWKINVRVRPPEQ